MAVILIEELEQAQASVNRLYQRTYTRIFRVTCDSRADGPKTVGNAPGLPHVGNSYSRFAETDTRSFVDQVDIVQERLTNVGGSTGSTWIYTAKYSPYDSSTYGPDPLAWPLRISVGSQQFDKVVWEDINGDPIVNSSGQRFAEPITMDDSRPWLKVIRNEANYNPTLLTKFKDKLNSDPFLGAEPYQVKSMPPTAEILYSSEIGYYAEVTYMFNFDENKFKKIPLDQGFCELDGSGKLRQILDPNGQPLSEAALLDGSGHRLTSGGTPVYLDFDVYGEVPFSDFGFDFTGVPGFQLS